LTLRAVMGEMLPANGMYRKTSTPELFSRTPVSSLEEAARELAPPGGRAGTVGRLKHHLATGRLKLAGGGQHAVVPPGTAPDPLRPAPFLAAAARPDAVFSHHAALELLGAAHSAWPAPTARSWSSRPESNGE